MQFPGLSPKLIKSWSHSFCFEKRQGFKLAIPSLLTSSSCRGTSVWKTTQQQAQRSEAWQRLNPMHAAGRVPHPHAEGEGSLEQGVQGEEPTR